MATWAERKLNRKARYESLGDALLTPAPQENASASDDVPPESWWGRVKQEARSVAQSIYERLGGWPGR